MKKLYGLLSMLLIVGVFNSEAHPHEKKNVNMMEIEYTSSGRKLKAKKLYKEMKAEIIFFEVITGKKTLVLSSYILKELDKADQIKRLQFKNCHRITNHAQSTIKTRCSGAE